MKIMILTTDSHHHTYFVREVMKSFPISGILIETGSQNAPFDTQHPFEIERTMYETGTFFNGANVKLADIYPAIEVTSVNDATSEEHLKLIRPDLVLVFGTRKIKKKLIAACPGGFINLHGGNPEEYRGLDTHLWAIYHRDFENLIVTLHHLNEALDDGDIILQAPISLKRAMKIHEIRRYNTEICIKLALSAFDMFSRHGYLISRPQLKRGRYYSSMPGVLKEMCCRTFHKFTDNLQ